MKVVVNKIEHEVSVRVHSGEVVHNGEVIGVIERKGKRQWISHPNVGIHYDCATRKDAVYSVLEQTLKGANKRE